MSREVLSDFHRHYLAAVVTGRQHAALWEHDLRVGAQNARDGTWRIPQAWTPGTRSARSISSGNLEDPGRFDPGGAGADRFDSDHWHRQVDIYLSAGFNSGEGYADQPSCNHVNTDNCGIYRVRWDLARGEAVEVERIIPNRVNYSATKPSVNPSNTAIAYQARSRVARYGGSEQITELRIKNLNFSSLLVSSSHDEDGLASAEGSPHFSHWAKDEALWFHKERNHILTTEAVLYQADIEYRRSDMVIDTREIQAPVPDISLDYNDPHVHYDPAVGSFLGNSPPYIVTHGPSTEVGLDVSVPKVHRKNAYSEALWNFDLSIAADGSTKERGGCAHTAWNINGSQILCSLQEDSSSTAYNNDPVFIDDVRQRMIYGFSLFYDWSEPYGLIWKNTSSNEHGTLFDPMTPEDLQESFQRTVTPYFSFTVPIFPTPPSGLSGFEKNFYIYTYKNAEWCGTDDYVVTNLFITYKANPSDPESDTQVLASRVMLIRISTGQYWDVTQAVEDKYFSGGDYYNPTSIHSTVHAVFASCSPLMEGTLFDAADRFGRTNMGPQAISFLSDSGRQSYGQEASYEGITKKSMPYSTHAAHSRSSSLMQRG